MRCDAVHPPPPTPAKVLVQDDTLEEGKTGVGGGVLCVSFNFVRGATIIGCDLLPG